MNYLYALYMDFIFNQYYHRLQYKSSSKTLTWTEQTSSSD